MKKCKNCYCDCHCSLQEHSDDNGVCACQDCKCNPSATVANSNECESCQ